MELVAADPEIRKIVDIAFDDAGRLWAVTAGEYPIDGNESASAAALYSTGGKDQVLVFDDLSSPGRRTPRVFADGLALPMAILPWRDGALVGHGPEILFLRDTDGDGRADRREVVLSGFGIQDSHLLPHRFVRGPSGWIHMAQGAFNESRVRTRDGGIVDFRQCKVARFTADGARFEIEATGLNNVWGLVLDRRGRLLGQEANDLGYPVVRLFHGTSLPGIGDHRARPHAPWQPATAAFRLGGTGLSGLAIAEDRESVPASWSGRALVANPIENAVQSVAVSWDGAQLRLARGDDLLRSSDPRFRPVAVHCGPDGALWVVDWYNPIISHNEVPRSHPERDRTRSRLWRVRRADAARRAIPDLTRVPDTKLVERLDAPSAWEARAAWHQIADRPARALVPDLERLVADRGRRTEARILALWCLEDLGAVRSELLRALAEDSDGDLRRESLRAASEGSLPESVRLDLARAAGGDADASVRFAAIRAVATSPGLGAESVAWLLGQASRALAADRDEGADLLAAQTRFERDFEVHLVRCALEDHRGALAEMLARIPTVGSGAPSPAARRLGFLALGGAEGARLLARERAGEAPPRLDAEEWALFAAHAGDADVALEIRRRLADAGSARPSLERLVGLRDRADRDALAPLLLEATRGLLDPAAPPSDLLLALRIASAFALRDLAPAIERRAREGLPSTEARLAVVRALREAGSRPAGLLRALARLAVPGEPLAAEAAAALAESPDADAPGSLLELWPQLDGAARRSAVRALARSKAGALVLAEALVDGAIDAAEVDARAFAAAVRAAGDGALRDALRETAAGRARPVLVLAGGGDDWVDLPVTLRGPFTVEAWVRLEPGISNADGILGRPGGADLNFADGRFRLYAGPGAGDLVIAPTAVEAGRWTHVAVVRDAEGHVAIHRDGERVAEAPSDPAMVFDDLRVGRTTPASGTEGTIAELRVWSVARTEQEIGGDRQRSYAGRARPASLVLLVPDPEHGTPLHGAARVEAALDGPPLASEDDLRAASEKLDRYRALAARGGDGATGRRLFAQHCSSCHSVGGEGGSIGPVLDGAGGRGVESLLRALVTPSASLEPGYRTFLLETIDGERIDGFLASRDEERLVVRRAGREDAIVPRARIRSSRFEEISVMPEGLLEALGDEDAASLLGYLLTLR